MCFQRKLLIRLGFPTNGKISQATLPTALLSRAHRCQEKDEIQHFRPGGNCECEKFGFELCLLEMFEKMFPNTISLWGIVGGSVLKYHQNHIAEICKAIHLEKDCIQLMASWKRGLLMKNDRYLVPWRPCQDVS